MDLPLIQSVPISQLNNILRISMLPRLLLLPLWNTEKNYISNTEKSDWHKLSASISNIGVLGIYTLVSSNPRICHSGVSSIWECDCCIPGKHYFCGQLRVYVDKPDTKHGDWHWRNISFMATYDILGYGSFARLFSTDFAP